jgi:hypothetical protein
MSAPKPSYSAGADLIATKPDAYRGVALLSVNTDANELRRLHALGFRRVRFNYMSARPCWWITLLDFILHE